MKTWHIENENRIGCVESALSREEGEVKLKMSKVTVSSTDISFFASDEDKNGVTVPGHSGVAFMSEDDAQLGLKMGARVVVSPYLSYEEHGVRKVRVMGVDCDGLMSDFVTVPAENVYALPDGIPDEEAIFTEYIALGINAFNSMNAGKGDYLVIVGASTLGLIISQLAVYYQMVPILVDLDADKLALAENWGIYYTLNPTYDNVERRVEEITGGRMAEVSVYAGEGIPFSSAIRLVKDMGETIIAGYSAHARHQIEMDAVLKKQLTVKGVSNGKTEMASAINLLANRIVKTDGLITSRVSFDDFREAVEDCVKYPYKYNKIMIVI